MNRIDRSIAEASRAVDRTLSHRHYNFNCPACDPAIPLRAGIEPEWSAEDRRLAARQLEGAIRAFRRYAGRAE